MEPIFDPRGNSVGWLRNEVVFDADIQPVAFIRQNAVFSYGRLYLGRFDRLFFRDLDGHAVGFVRGASGSPRPPTPSVPRPPRLPSIPRVPAVAPVPPAAPVASLSWSPLTWHQFLGGAEQYDLAAQPLASSKSGTETESRGGCSDSLAPVEKEAHAESSEAVKIGASR